MTTDELCQHVIDVIAASGYTGAAVLVLAWQEGQEVHSTIGSNMDGQTEVGRKGVAAMLDMAAALTRSGEADSRTTMAPRTPVVRPS